MGIQEDFSTSAEHEIALTVRSLMVAICDLAVMAADASKHKIIEQSAEDLELSHHSLGYLLDTLGRS